MVYLLKKEPKVIDWSAAKPLKVKDHLLSHVLINKPKFLPSWDPKSKCQYKQPPNLPNLLTYEYARVWHKEHDDFVERQKKAEYRKFIRMDIPAYKKKLLERREKKVPQGCRKWPKVYTSAERIIIPPPVLPPIHCSRITKNYATDRRLTCRELSVLKLPKKFEKRSQNGLYPEYPYLSYS